MLFFFDIVLEVVLLGEKIDYCFVGGFLFFMLFSYYNYIEMKCLVYNLLMKCLRELFVFCREWVVGVFLYFIVDI